MNRSLSYIFIILFFNCTKSVSDIDKIKESVYIPSNYNQIYLNKTEDFLTDGSSEIILIFKIDKKEYGNFLKTNKLISFKKSNRWADYYTEDFNFYPYLLKKKLNLPKYKDLDNLYYNHWEDKQTNIECFFDSENGLAIIKYEW